MSNDLKLCYFYKKDYELVRSLFPNLVVLDIKRGYYYQTFLSESDINYLKLSFPETLIVHEGGKYDYLNFNYTNIKYLPKNIEVDNLSIRHADIHYIHSSIKVNIFHSYDNQLYHIRSSYGIKNYKKEYALNSSYGIKNYKQEREKLDTIGEEAYYKEIDEICEKMYEESYNAYLKTAFNS